MAQWLYPANTKFYDVFAALDQTQAYWPMNSKVAVGDELFIYLAAPYKQVAYRCEVTEINVPAELAFDACKPFFIGDTPDPKSSKPFMLIEPKAAYERSENSPLRYAELKLYGLNGMLMGPRKLDNNPTLLAYMQLHR